MIELSDSARQTFNDDGFVVVEKLIEHNQIATLHRAFTDLFNGSCLCCCRCLNISGNGNSRINCCRETLQWLQCLRSLLLHRK